MWVHCPRASNGLLPRRSNLVGYVRWDARSDRFPPCQNHSNSFQVAVRVARHPPTIVSKCHPLTATKGKRVLVSSNANVASLGFGSRRGSLQAHLFFSPISSPS